MSHPVSSCIICAKPTVMSCNRCWRVQYCSTDCQHAHWPVHHVNCIPTIHNPPPPVDVQFVQALVLFAHSPARHWRMIEVQVSVPLGLGGPRVVPQFTADFNLGDQPGSTLCLTDVGGSQLNQPYQIFFRSLFLTDGSPTNMGVRSLHPEITYPWAGNIVVFKFDGSRRQRYRHMEQSDLVQIAQFFRTYPGQQST